MQKNSAITLFGGSGDLTYRKLLPALYNLESTGKLSDDFKIIAIGRRDYSCDQYLEIAQRWIETYARKKFDSVVFNKFKKRVIYFKMDVSDVEEYYRLQQFYDNQGINHHIYYYAVAPSLFIPITNGLKKYSATNQAKVIIEKPFGEDLASATQLNTTLAQFFGQDEIYHIDHYLGKEMIQNIISLRANNIIFKEIWNNKCIESIQISASESEGVGTRAGYYDKSGALKDMVQNHLFQVLSIVVMDNPEGDFATEQLKVFNRLCAVSDYSKEVVRGQYAGYLAETNISPQSQTETFVALKLFVENDRFSGVPIYIKTGKKLKHRETQLAIKFRQVGNSLPNSLIIKIQPDEGVNFKFNIKKPGTITELQQVSMDFCQSCVLENRINTPEAYERLLYACMNDDRSLFSRWDQIVASWKFANEISAKFDQIPLEVYEQGSEGPESAIAMTEWIV